MKKVLIVLVILSLFLVVGCSSSDSGQEVNFDQVLNDVVEKISQDLRDQGYTDDDFADETLPSYVIIDLTSNGLYDGLIDFTKVSAAFTIRASWDTNADRITVFEVSDKSYLNTIKGILEEENSSQREIWESYIPEQFKKVRDTIMEIEGNIIYYITYEDAEAIEDVILNALK